MPTPKASPFKTLSESQVNEAYRVIIRLLKASTGLSHELRGVVACWIIACRALKDPAVKLFAMLTIVGKMSTGKSTILRIAEFFTDSAKKCCSVSTFPMIRELFISQYEKVAVLEEADGCQHDAKDGRFEELLNSRYDRRTSRGGIRVQTSETNARTQETKQSLESRDYDVWGACAMHRRRPFHDAVLDSKSVFIRCRPDQSRSYVEFNESDPIALQVREMLMSHCLTLPQVTPISGVAERVFSNYRPLLGVASLIDDPRLNAYLDDTMKRETERLSRSQGEEPDAQVMGVIIEHVLAKVEYSEATNIIAGNANVGGYITAQEINNQIGPDNSGRRMGAYAVANICRDLGFRVEEHRHQQRIYLETNAFLRGCSEAGIINDKVVNAFRAAIMGRKKKEEKQGGICAGEANFSTLSPEVKDLMDSDIEFDPQKLN